MTIALGIVAVLFGLVSALESDYDKQEFYLWLCIAFVILTGISYELSKTLKMEIIKKFVIYELNNVMGNERHKALEKINLNVVNDFNTEEEAIQALIDDEKKYETYIILMEVYIR